MTLLQLIRNIILIIVFLAIILLAYFGFMPGLSSFIGTSNPRNLGIKYIDIDYDSAARKNQVQIIVVDFAKDIEFSAVWQGSRYIKNSFSSEEITARINKNSGNWKYFPVKSVQVRFEKDGTAEISGIVILDNLKGFAIVAGFPEEDIEKAESFLLKYNLQKLSIPFYVKGKANVENNLLELDLSKVEIGRFPLPDKTYEGIEVYLEEFVSHKLNRYGLFGVNDVTSLDFNNGKLNFKGYLPMSITIAKEVGE